MRVKFQFIDSGTGCESNFESEMSDIDEVKVVAALHYEELRETGEVVGNTEIVSLTKMGSVYAFIAKCTGVPHFGQLMMSGFIYIVKE